MKKHTKIICGIVLILVVGLALLASFSVYREARQKALLDEFLNEAFPRVEDEVYGMLEQGVEDMQNALPQNNYSKTEDSADTSSIDTANAEATETKKVNIGETVISEKFSITLLECSTTDRVDDSSYSYYEADDGMIFAIAVFRIENLTQTDETIQPALNFEYYADNVLCKPVGLGFSPPNINGYRSISNDDILRSGRTIEGYVSCEIPVATQILEIEYEGFVFEYDISNVE